MWVLQEDHRKSSFFYSFKLVLIFPSFYNSQIEVNVMPTVFVKQKWHCASVKFKTFSNLRQILLETYIPNCSIFEKQQFWYIRTDFNQDKTKNTTPKVATILWNYRTWKTLYSDIEYWEIFFTMPRHWPTEIRKEQDKFPNGKMAKISLFKILTQYIS